MQNKQELRKWAKEYRKFYNFCGDELAFKLSTTKEFQIAKNIMLFYPIEGEVCLLSLLDQNDKTFYLPRMCGQSLEACPYNKGDELVISKYKIPEPITKAVDKKCIDMVIVPALCCDINNYRLGYGGGFYDRFLSDFNGIKIACIEKEFIVKSVFAEKHDIAMDLVISK